MPSSWRLSCAKICAKTCCTGSGWVEKVGLIIPLRYVYTTRVNSNTDPARPKRVIFSRASNSVLCRFLLNPSQPSNIGRGPAKLQPAAALCRTTEAREMAFLVLLQLATASSDSADVSAHWMVATQFMLALSQHTRSNATSTTPVSPLRDSPKMDNTSTSTKTSTSTYSYDATAIAGASANPVDVACNIDIGAWDVRIKDLTQSALGYTGLKNQALTVGGRMFECY